VLGLQPLAEQVTLPVQDGARRSRRTAGEGDQAGVGRGQLDAGRGIRGVQRRVGGEQHGAGRAGGLQHRAAALVGEDGRRRGHRDPVGQVRRAQLLVARQRHRADAEAGQHRLHPLDPVADQQQHDVAAADADALQGAGKPRAAFG
jgi:hypothetical protein